MSARTSDEKCIRQCIHGKAPHERCIPCEKEAEKGNSAGFVARTSNELLDAAQAILKARYWDANCNCDKCKSFRRLEAAVIFETEQSARSLAEVSNTDGRHQVSTLINAGSSPAGRANHEYVDCPQGTGCPRCYGWKPTPYETGEQRIAVETPQSRSLFDMADNLIREMRKQDMWGMRSEYDNWTLRITRNEPTPAKAGER